jgi:hypothetical protein
MRNNCNNWLGIMCDTFAQSGHHDDQCCNARNREPAPMTQTYVVIIYPSGKKHVAPLYPAKLTPQSALDVAKTMAYGEGRGREAFDGDWIRFCTVAATTAMQAVGMIVTMEDFNRCAVHGGFSL